MSIGFQSRPPCPPPRAGGRRARIPHGHWKTSTLVARRTLAGIVAPYIVDGAMTGAIFLAYIRQILAPALKPGDIIRTFSMAFSLNT